VNRFSRESDVTETEPKPGDAVLPPDEAAAPDPTLGADARPDPRKAGMACFLVSEAAFFSTLLMVYVLYLKNDATPPSPADVLALPLVLATTTCLLSSSATIHFAEAALHAGRVGRFRLLWAVTTLLGAVFLAGTAFEWTELFAKGLTPATNLFGTTYYTLVGFHAFHVSLGVLALAAVLLLSARGHLPGKAPIAVTLVSWYWHFVDVVWILVFLIVYVAGR
jgi:cytochrome c oxidase subunit 3